MDKYKIHALLKRKILVLDGATGTELQRRGMPSGVCPETWCIENSDIISSVHSSYSEAGSDIVYTCTFGANRFKLEQFGETDVYGINKNLAQIAAEAVGRKVLIAGDIAPTGKFVEPFGSLAFEEAVDAYKEQVRGLLDGGVDMFVIETQMDIQEARAALLAVKELCDKFVMVTMTYEADARTLNGTDPRSALITLQSLGADAVGCNCSMGPEGMLKFLAAMKPYAKVPLVAKPNAGMPKLIKGETVFDMGPAHFASFAEEFSSIGVNLIGGCCGTTPEHIAALKASMGMAKPIFPVVESISALSSARSSIVYEGSTPFSVIGERINPTGKQKLMAELQDGKCALVRNMAKEQQAAGAAMLDVNVGMPGIDEKETMLRVVKELSSFSSLPLVIDSGDPDVIEAALRIYPGRALINSVTAEKDKMDRVFPVAVKYGAMIIALPLTETGIPSTGTQRVEVIKELLAAARRHGIASADIIVDVIAMAVSSSPEAGVAALEVIDWCTKKPGVGTTMGLSNISFGLPERPWLNASFLAMAIDKGLTTAIANPCCGEFMNVKVACDLLLNKDPDSLKYIEHFAPCEKTVSISSADGEYTERTVYQAVVDGARDAIEEILDALVKKGISPALLVEETMISAINHVGELFDQKKYFLPQLIASAETMKIGFEFLEPMLKKTAGKQNDKPVILLATVEGDIHDIGKNIVALMLRNQGFEVKDLGKDVGAADIISAINEHQPHMVGLSALMTTTMNNMKKVVQMAEQRGIKTKFVVGGAVVTEDFAESIGAYYAKDGVEAVKVAKKIINNS